jgi:hypothetical protein
VDTNKNFAGFLAFAKQNENVKKELQALSGLPYDASVAKVVEVGARNGYTFATDDVEEMLDEALGNKALKSGELTDEQLEAVAGGAGGGKGAAVGGLIEAGIGYLIDLAID